MELGWGFEGCGKSRMCILRVGLYDTGRDDKGMHRQSSLG